jgi:hypothetical protein
MKLLENIACGVYKLHGLAPMMDERYIKRMLLEHGLVTIHEEALSGELVCLPSSISSTLDINGNPTDYNVWGANGFTAIVPADDCAVIWHNDARSPYIQDIRFFAERLSNIERAITMNVDGQKTVPIFEVAADEILNATQTYEQITQNTPVIFERLGNSTAREAVYFPTAPFTGDKLMDLFNATWNEFYTFIGINNANNDKKERLVTDEVTSNDEQIDISRALWIEPIARGLVEANEKFGLEMMIEYVGR